MFCIVTLRLTPKKIISTKDQLKPTSWNLMNEFTEPRAMCTYVLTQCTCQRGLRSNVIVCQRGLHGNVHACQRAKSVPTSHFYVPACQKTCQHAMRHANVLTWHANIPKASQFPKHSLYKMSTKISILHYYINNSTLYLISS